MNSYLVSYNFFLFCKDYYKTSNKLTRPVQKYLLFFIFWIKFLNTMGITRIWRKSHLGLVVVFYFMKYRRFTDEIQTWNTVVVFYFMKFQTYDHDSLSKPDSRRIEFILKCKSEQKTLKCFEMDINFRYTSQKLKSLYKQILD